MRHNIYFIGAGGIGMAALERYCLAHGLQVAGYDRTPSELTDDLVHEGVNITFEDAVDTIDPRFRDPADTLVVRTPAVPEDSVQLTWFRNHGFEIVKRAALLGTLTKNGRPICISGTHGKTTVTSMVAHILHVSPAGCNAFVGGVMRNYGTNYLIDPSSDLSVVEADEYDRSFHHLTPYVAVVTSVDPDHLDIYGTPEAYRESFARFTELIRPGGALLMHTGLPLVPRTAKDVRIHTYGRTDGDYHASGIRYRDGHLLFDFVMPDGTVIPDISAGVPVQINVENAVAALAAVHLAGVFEPESARRAMETFAGPHRRFERHILPQGKVVIDDYAHHPDELHASIESVRALYPDRCVTVAFQPHLYSRTRDFAAAFGHVLSLADDVILLPVYPAREDPIPGVESDIIARHIDKPHILLFSRQELPQYLAANPTDVLLIAGAGDIADMVAPSVQTLSDIRSDAE